MAFSVQSIKPFSTYGVDGVSYSLLNKYIGMLPLILAGIFKCYVELETFPMCIKELMWL